MNTLMKKTMTVMALALSLSLVLGTTLVANEGDMGRLANNEIVSEIDRDNCRYDEAADLWFCKL